MLIISQKKVMATPAIATTPATRALTPAASGATAAAGATEARVSALVYQTTD